MLKDNWLARQLQTVRELLQQGQELSSQNKLVEAEAKLKEASIILASAEMITADVLKMRYVVFGELATIAGRTGNAGAALNNYKKSLAAAEGLAADHDQPMLLEMITTCVNLGGVYGGVGRLREAEDTSRRALDLISSLPGDGGEHGKLMGVFANYHLGAALHAGPSPSDAYDALRSAVEGFEKLDNQAAQSARPLIIESITRLADIDAKNERFDNALEQETKAGEMLLELYEGSNQRPFLQGYVNSLSRLVGYGERGKRFDTAEDAIFKLRDLMPDNKDVVDRGKQFYEAILKLTDEELEAGGLPREEAQESLEELSS